MAKLIHPHGFFHLVHAVVLFLVVVAPPPCMVLTDAARVINPVATLTASSNEKAPTCSPIASACSKDKDCCSDSCLLFLCVLPYEDKKLELALTNMDSKKIAMQEKASTCSPFGTVCSKDKDCCSESCLLFLCALPYEDKNLEAQSKKVAIPEKAPSCLPFGTVCSKDQDCCSDSCLLLFCALPYEDNKAELPLARTM